MVQLYSLQVDFGSTSRENYMHPVLLALLLHKQGTTSLFVNSDEEFVFFMVTKSGFGGLEVACYPLLPKFAGSHPAEAVGFLGRKNPQHAFLRRGRKAVGPMS
jgi:hypothetical protein